MWTTARMGQDSLNSWPLCSPAITWQCSNARPDMYGSYICVTTVLCFSYFHGVDTYMFFNSPPLTFLRTIVFLNCFSFWWWRTTRNEVASMNINKMYHCFPYQRLDNDVSQAFHPRARQVRLPSLAPRSTSPAAPSQRKLSRLLRTLLCYEKVKFLYI